jgi:hypothetical protein
MFTNACFMINILTGSNRSGQISKQIIMKKICISLVIVLSFLAIEVKAQTVVVKRPARRVVVVHPPARVAVVRPVNRVVVVPTRVVIGTRPVLVYTAPPHRTVIVKKTVIYK